MALQVVGGGHQREKRVQARQRNPALSSAHDFSPCFSWYFWVSQKVIEGTDLQSTKYFFLSCLLL
jgi:hypothetical protein